MDIIKDIKEILIKNNEKITIKSLLEICYTYNIYNIDNIINEFKNNNILKKEELKLNHLSPNLQLYFINKAKLGDKLARDLLVKTNYNLVTYIVSRYYPNNSDTEDFIQCGLLGLVHAINNYNIDKLVPFPNYASRCILGYIKQSLPRYVNSISTTRSYFFLCSKIVKIEEILMKELKKEIITDQEILDRLKLNNKNLNISLKDICLLRQYSKGTYSLNLSIDNEEGTSDRYLMDIIISDDNIEEEVYNSVYNEIFFKILNREIDTKLNPMQLNVIKYRYGFDEEHHERTSDEVGKILGVTGARVRQIERDALRLLRKILYVYDEKNKEL